MVYLVGILEIEKECFAQAAWSAKDFYSLLQNNGTLYTKSPDGCVHGYMCFRRVRDGLELINIAVRPELRRMGIGRNMMDSFRGTIPRGFRIRCYASERNRVFHMFLQAVGFKAVKVKRGYFDGKIDAYLFSWRKA